MCNHVSMSIVMSGANQHAWPLWPDPGDHRLLTLLITPAVRTVSHQRAGTSKISIY